MKTLNVLDCCTEFGSETKAFKDRGHNVTLLGIEGNVDIIQDIRNFHTKEHYDFITFHPPCTCFSIASVGSHWNNHTPNSETLEAISVVKACVRIIEESNPDYWMIENPVGMLRTLDFMKVLERKNFKSVVTYCQYGDTSMKPTDLWHNIPNFHPKRCKNGDKCHSASPRHSHNTGSTQGKKNAKERALVPYGLSLEICKCIENLYIV